MTTITPHTDPTTLDECGRQAREMVTVDATYLDAVCELLDAVTLDDLSKYARELADDWGIDTDDRVSDYYLGEHLEGLLDYRTLRQANGDVLEVHMLDAFGGPTMWSHIREDGSVRKVLGWWGTSAEGSGQHDYYARVFEYMVELVDCQ